MYSPKEDSTSVIELGAFRSIGPDSVMSSGHVRQKASSCYQSILMSSAERGSIAEREEDEEEGKVGRGCCCSSEHQLDAAEVDEMEGGVESKTKGFSTFWQELKGDRLDLMLLLFLYTLQVTPVFQLILSGRLIVSSCPCV